MSIAPAPPLLEVEGLSVDFRGRGGLVNAVDRLSFSIGRGETLGLVGESGCGKSVTALAILGLLPRPQGRVAAGAVRLDGLDLLRLPERGLRRLRGRRVAMIFQEPMTSLNPLMRIGRQIAETVALHEGVGRRTALGKAVEMLDLVRIPDPERRAGEFPHQLSGGMRQRAMIAMALACRPDLLIADEATTALDVTIQAQILVLLAELQARLGMALLLISHNLGVIAEMAARIVVMYAGRKVEEASTQALFGGPRHPYTRALIAAIPRHASDGSRRRRLDEIPGMVPSLRRRLPGCVFAARCNLAIAPCRSADPALSAVAADHRVACLRADETGIGR